MNKSELVAAMAAKAELSKKDAEAEPKMKDETQAGATIEIDGNKAIVDTGAELARGRGHIGKARFSRHRAI